MSETPERIWAFAPDIFDNLSVWQDAPSPAGDTIEYVRADRIEELEVKLATCKKYRDAYAECDRIATQAVRDLEAKLVKAVDALGEAIYLLDPDEEDIAKETGTHRIVTTYAELTGGMDE